MQVISGLSDLNAYGIYVLTGEACSLGMRLLCDFDEQGLQILRDSFGISTFTGGEPWNTQTRGRRHVGSILLTQDMVSTIGVFALFSAGHVRVHHVIRPYDWLQTVGKCSSLLFRLVDIVDGLKESQLALERLRALVEQARPLLPKLASNSGLVSVGCLFGFTDSTEDTALEEVYKKLIEHSGLLSRVFAAKGEAAGYRNQHRMSGRSE